MKRSKKEIELARDKERPYPNQLNIMIIKTIYKSWEHKKRIYLFLIQQQRSHNLSNT